MPGRLLQTAAAGIVLGLCLPVLSFAIFTSIFALLLVGVRASVISSEFWISVIIESWTHGQKKAPSIQPSRPAIHKQHTNIEFRPAVPRSRTNSFIDTNAVKRLSHRSDSHLSLVGTPINRDFEGVGGWRSIYDADDSSLWTNMKTRLDQTRSSSRHHRRSVTGGSVQSTALNSPEFFPVAMKTPRHRPTTSGSASPQSYFNLQLPTSRSMVSLQAKRLSGNSSDKWDLAQHSEVESREPEQIGMAI